MKDKLEPLDDEEMAAITAEVEAEQEEILTQRCMRRAVELIWSDHKERTCPAVKQQLMNEFGAQTVANMVRRVDAELVRNL